MGRVIAYIGTDSHYKKNTLAILNSGYPNHEIIEYKTSDDIDDTIFEDIECFVADVITMSMSSGNMPVAKEIAQKGRVNRVVVLVSHLSDNVLIDLLSNGVFGIIKKQRGGNHYLEMKNAVSHVINNVVIDKAMSVAVIETNITNPVVVEPEVTPTVVEPENDRSGENIERNFIYEQLLDEVIHYNFDVPALQKRLRKSPSDPSLNKDGYSATELSNVSLCYYLGIEDTMPRYTSGNPSSESKICTHTIGYMKEKGWLS